MAEPTSPADMPDAGGAQMRGASAYPPGSTRGQQQAGEGIAEGVETIREEAARYASRQKHRMSDQVHSLRAALDDMCARLEQEQSPMAAPARKLASGLDSLTTALESANFSDMSRELQDFARRNPALFVGGAALAGFLAGRFLRSSGSHRNAAMGEARGEMGSDFYAGTAARRTSDKSFGGD